MLLTSATTLLTLLTSHLALAQEAPLATNQPSRVTYQAILQSDKQVQGTITGVSAENGTGVQFNINFYDFPDFATNGPFAYHIHVSPIDAAGNCTTALTHLAPFNGPNDTVPCDPATPQLCQVGDLSGKHGKITAEAAPSSKFLTTYIDPYVSAIEGSDAFFGNRSVVVHDKNSGRLNCANFMRMDDAMAPSGGDGGAGATSTATGGVGGGGGEGSATATASGGQVSPSGYESGNGASGGKSVAMGAAVLGALGLMGVML